MLRGTLGWYTVILGYIKNVMVNHTGFVLSWLCIKWSFLWDGWWIYVERCFIFAGDRGPDINAESLLDDVCINALEHAKSKYKSAMTSANDQQQSAPLTVGCLNSVRDVRLTQSGTVVQLPSNPSLTIEPTVLSVNSKSNKVCALNIKQVREERSSDDF